MTRAFEYSDFRKFLKARFKQMPKGGYGQAKRMATFLGIHTTLVSQVLSGKKTFTAEQAALASEFFGLVEVETEYFLTLVQLDRAGNESLRKILRKQLSDLRERSKELSTRLVSQRRLTEQERALFYSDWTYTAVRQLTAIEGFQRPERIAAELGLTLRQAQQVLNFLIKTGLCVDKKGKVMVGPNTTHLESSSPWVNNHHTNWRLKAIELFHRTDDSTLHYTAPMTLSHADAVQLRELIVKFLESVDRVVEPSTSEGLHCLSIDWFSVTPTIS